jgi:fluoride exporter
VLKKTVWEAVCIYNMNYVYVFLGGGIGSVLRFVISVLLNKTTFTLPIATFVANVISCAIFGILVLVYQQKSSVPDTYKHLVLIGICGGLSTFSTFSFETYELFKTGLYGWAIVNIIFSCTICVGLFFVLAKNSIN